MTERENRKSKEDRKEERGRRREMRKKGAREKRGWLRSMQRIVQYWNCAVNTVIRAQDRDCDWARMRWKMAIAARDTHSTRSFACIGDYCSPWPWPSMVDMMCCVSAQSLDCADCSSAVTESEPWCRAAEAPAESLLVRSRPCKRSFSPTTFLIISSSWLMRVSSESMYALRTDREARGQH